MTTSNNNSSAKNARIEPHVSMPADQSVHPVIDIGINLTNDRFSKDLPRVLHRATEAGCTHLLLTGTSVRASRDALAMCQRFSKSDANANVGAKSSFPVLRCTVGVHPHDAKTWNAQTLASIRAMLSGPKARFVVAVGECGLDFNRMFSPQDAQEAAFEAQLRLAAEFKLPLFLHQRDAHDVFLKILSKHRDQLTAPIVVHCFTGALAECKAYLDLGCYIGLTGFICDEREGRGAHLAEVAAAIPLDRLLIETDGPYVLPRNIPRAVQRTAVVSGRCEPWMVVYVLQKLAQLRGVTTADGVAALARALHENSVRVFRLDQKHDESVGTLASDDNDDENDGDDR